MPIHSKRPRGRPSKKKINPAASADITEPTSSSESAHNSGISNTTTKQSRIPLQNDISQSNITKCDQSLVHVQPRMTVDGTCAPPRVTSIDKNFHFLMKTPPITPPKVFHARMSTGGRAPPKTPSPPKDNSTSPKWMTTPTLSSPMVLITTPERASAKRGRPRKFVKRILINPDVAVKRPRGRPKKAKRPVGRPRKNLLNQSGGITEVTKRPPGRPKKNLTNVSIGVAEGLAKRPPGRPKKSLTNVSIGVAEGLAKRPPGRPKKSLTNASIRVAEGLAKRPRGRPKGSTKKPAKMPTGRASQSEPLSALLTAPCMVLNQLSSKSTVSTMEVTKLTRLAAWKISSVKQQRPVGRPRKSTGKSSTGSRREIETTSKC